MAELQVVPARKGKAVRLAKGQHLKCINTHGTQVIDMWAFDSHDMGDIMSMHHTHSCLKRLMPREGESFYTYTRRPILTVIEDHSPGVHDTVLPACDKFRYIWDGHEGYHDSCGDNLAASLRALGLEPPRFTPQPFNLWMNNPIGRDGSIGYLPPVTNPGDYIVLRAEMDCVVSMSACPYDLANVAINRGEVRDVHFEVS